MTRSSIYTRGLRREFGGGVVAVEALDLRVEQGEIFAFLGPNGAGKTTTVRMLTTLLRPTSGEANVAGFDLFAEQHEVRKHIGVALQEAGLDPLATGRELLELQAQLYGARAAPARERAAELLALVGLSDAADRQVKTYSGGMKRRLDLASALVHRPHVLFLDEPTEGLDPASRQAIWQEVHRLNHDLGVTVFLTTHYMEEADRLAGRVAIIDHGRIVAQGTPEALKASVGGDVVTIAAAAQHLPVARAVLGRLEGVRELRADESGLMLISDDGGAAAAHILRALDSAGVETNGVSVSRPSLDEVFLRATGSRLEGAGAPTHPPEKEKARHGLHH